MTITTPVHFTTTRSGRKRLHAHAKPVVEALPGRIPRVSKLMALAIRFDGLLRDGTVGDQSELARLAGVTQPRITQIMNLNHLAPDIQEELLFLPEVEEGRDQIHERMLRPICAEILWDKQQQTWTDIIESQPHANTRLTVPFRSVR